MCSNGNWMHILYQSKLQAKKVNYWMIFKWLLFIFQALSKNGKIFGNDIMVGVQPCIDKVSIFPNLFNPFNVIFVVYSWVFCY